MARRPAGHAAAALFCATLLAALPACTSAHTSPSAPPRAAAGQSAPRAAATPNQDPGANPSIQHWFLKVGNAQVAFDNALLRAEQGIAKHEASMCRPLEQKVQPILSAFPSLRNIASAAGSELADTIEPAMRTFSRVAKRCTAGDFGGARALLRTGVRQQADAQNTIDEILDGDLGSSQ